MNALKKVVLWSGITLAALLQACGGGGGSSGNSAGTPGGPPVLTGSPTMVVSVVGPGGTPENSISLGGNQSVRAVVRDAQGAPAVGLRVEFIVNPATLAGVQPSSALTNAEGIAQAALAPSSLTASGAGTVEASAQLAGAQLTGRFDFAVQAVNVTLSPIQFGTTTLAAGGNTQISVQVRLGGQAASGNPVTVNLRASCGRINDQDAVAGVNILTDGNGQASAVYRAVSVNDSLCNGRISVAASAAGADTVASNLNVMEPPANAIAFIGAQPARIFVSGSGSQEQANVRFTVLSGTTPLPNQAVRASIAVNPGGVGLNAAGNTSPITATTDSSGQVEFAVFAGTIPGPVKLRVELVSNTLVYAETQNLTVASGPPSQRFMSLAVGTFNIEGWAFDGANTNLTVRIADRQGNPVQDGTVINFTAEGGQVQQSCATAIVNGVSQCTVNFESQNPRPAGGRASILAYVAGTKDYVDNNLNNRFDIGGDTLIDIGDAFRDDNEDALFEAGEFVVPRGGALACPSVGAPFPSRANTCDGQLGTTVRQQTVILFSSSEPLLTTTTVGVGGVSFLLGSADNPLLPMPAGTTISASAFDSNTQDDLACSVDRVLGTPVVNRLPGTNPNANLQTFHSVLLKDCVIGDSVNIAIRSPRGFETVYSFGLIAGTNGGQSPGSGPADNLIAETPQPAQIFVAGNGLAEESAVTFVARAGASVAPNTTLTLSLVNNVGGVQLGTRGNTSPITAVTDSTGRVRVSVYSGTVPTPVRIRAQLQANPQVFVENQNLTIASGPPSQRFFSLSVDRFNIEGGEIDGTPIVVTVRAADRQGNAVPDGTVVNFTAEGGQIGRSCTLLRSSGNISSCSVVLESQSPRPNNGRVSILAFAEGTKDYDDLNGNNRFDAGDTLVNIGDAYRDDNESGVYDAGEFVIARNVSGASCSTNSGAPAPARANTCDGSLNTTVRRQINVMFSDSNARLVGIQNSPSIASASTVTNVLTSVSLRVASARDVNLPMPAETEFSATAIQDQAAGPSCTVVDVFPTRVGNIQAGTNPSASLSTIHEVRMLCTGPTGAVRLTVKSKQGVETSVVYRLN
jgi:hypothetical protein